MKTILTLLLSVGVLCASSRAGDMEDVARAYNRMGFHLLAQCRQSLPNTNYFLSPAGLAFALSMAQNGAKGETLRQMMATLQVTKITPPRLNEANKALLDHLSKFDPRSHTELEIANALWIDQKASIKTNFVALNHRYYDAEVDNGDFQDPETVKKINDWVSTRTHQKIRDILEPPLDPLLRLIVLDAIHFKASWQAPFDTNQTRDLPFTLTSGQAVSHPRMSHTGRFSYGEHNDFQVVELPYAEADISMFVFLPKGGLDQFLKKFNFVDMEGPAPERRSREGTVELPRFKLENDYDLNHVLALMGMPLAFSEVLADFRSISDEPLYISFVKQKTFLDVNELGTEASAATHIRMSLRGASPRPEEPFHFVVDRPFFIVIRENQTGLILFLGAIFDPR